MIKCAIFDLDGVIVDTAKYHYIAWKEIAENLGFEFTEKDNERLKGVSRMESLEILLSVGKISMPSNEKETLAKAKNERYKSLISNLKPDEILPGAKQFIEFLRAKRILIALASASKNAQFIIEKLNIVSLFDAIIDAHNIKNPKPNPEIFLKAAEVLNLHPKECVVFEDAEAGVEAAKAAGMKCIGIGNPEILKNADFVVSGLNKLKLRHTKFITHNCLMARK